MAKRPITRNCAISLRIPPKVRFGLDLLVRKHKAPLSTIVERGLDLLFLEEGLGKRKDGELLSLLDRLWSESEATRALKMHQFARDLMTDPEHLIVEAILDAQAKTNVRLTQKQMDQIAKETLQRFDDDE